MVASVQADTDSKLAALPRSMTADEVRQIAHDLISSVADVLVENIAAVFASRKQIKQLREEIGQLRADLTIQKAHGSGEVIDLPALPLRNRRA